MLNILFLILGVFIGLSLESFFGAFTSFSVIFLVILFLYGKADWKILLTFSVTISLILDVVTHYVLGAYLLVFSISILVMYLLSLFIPDQDSVFGMLPILISGWIFYILLDVFPTLISFGEWNGLTLLAVFKSLLLSVVSVILLWGLDIILGRVRGDKLNSKLRLR